MEAATWTAIGVLAATSLGTLFYLGSRIDALAGRLDAKIDAGFGRLDARFDAMESRLGHDPRNRFHWRNAGPVRS